MKIPRLVIPILAVVLMFAGYSLRLAFTNPSTDIAFAEENISGNTSTITALVDGVKCKGTAEFFTQLYKDKAGILSITTYAAEHKVVIDFDPDQITPDEIKAIMEQEITFSNGTSAQVFSCREMNVK